jgi:hypothetical protein
MDSSNNNNMVRVEAKLFGLKTRPFVVDKIKKKALFHNSKYVQSFSKIISKYLLGYYMYIQ